MSERADARDGPIVPSVAPLAEGTAAPASELPDALAQARSELMIAPEAGAGLLALRHGCQEASR